MLAYVPQFVCEVRDQSAHRLCRGSAGDPDRMRQRALAHQLIFKHAMDAGISLETDEMQHFARESFLLSRQCGAAGLAEESSCLFELARQASGIARSEGLDFRIYKIAASLLGWKVDTLLSDNSLTQRLGFARPMRAYSDDGKSGVPLPRAISIFRKLAWRLLLLELWGQHYRVSI